MNQVHTIQRHLLRNLVFKNLVIFLAILIAVSIAILALRLIPISEWKYLTALLILLVVPLLIITEQIYYSVNRKLKIEKDTFTYFIGTTAVLEFSRKDIQQLIVFEVAAETRFYLTDVRFGALRINGNHEIIIPGIMCENLIGLTLDKSEMKKVMLPSIFLYLAFLSNDF